MIASVTRDIGSGAAGIYQPVAYQQVRAEPEKSEVIRLVTIGNRKRSPKLASRLWRKPLTGAGGDDASLDTLLETPTADVLQAMILEDIFLT